MSATTSDIKIASIAMGFTLGFGLLTVWEAWKQTRRNRNPLRSTYIYMLWGEILANIIIAIIGWIFLDGIIGPTVPVLFFILFFWVFEVQLLMQIIVNRISIIAEHRSTIFKLKWGTALTITLINIAVFAIWIPAHTVPPASQTFVRINEVWDRVSKVLILLVDAGLNWYFLRTVKKRLVEQHRLKKYEPLVGFNAKLMIISILMDGMLIGLMSLPNQVVYIQFHPVAYMVKLNIEMSMAKLITRLAKGENADDYYPSMSHSGHHQSNNQRTNDAPWTQGNNVQLTHRSKVVAGDSDEDLSGTVGRHNGGPGIHRRTEFEVTVETKPQKNPFREGTESLDELPLTSNTGHPKQAIVEESPYCEATISNLIQASPKMLEQYLECESTITRHLLKRDFDDKMIQDAMGIVLFPSPRESRRSTRLVHAHLHSWKLRELPNPLVTRDIFLMDQLDKLHSLLMVFVEDYITKATATFPPREYICLPQPSHNQSFLIFKGQKVTKRFDSIQIAEVERKRFLRAFLRVELLSLVRRAINSSYSKTSSIKKIIKKLTRRDAEALRCAWAYVSTLYGAIFAHCADAWLPAADEPAGTGLLFPDSLFIDPQAYGKDIGIELPWRSDIDCMARYGLSLIFAMIRFAITRPQDKKALETFVKKLCRFGKDNALARILFFDRSIYFEDMYDMVYLRFPYRSDVRQNLNLPRLWWKYDSTLYWYHVYLKIKIFQQRAWVFFEDDCYYPKDTTAVPVFPSKEHLDCMAQDLVNKTLSLVGPGPVSTAQLERTRREFRRSQKWQDKMKPKEGNTPGTESSSSLISMGNHEISLPDIENGEQLLTWSPRGVVRWDVSEEAYVLNLTL
ncbi:uncharacterized protein FOBCDRAFT_253361 [Fusarium oxysporum Fo47]|uniref:uncharacterized protein n=1 Tax=Fusarium oxysporum Fo47 TaxID=660027 RepID=UPI0028698E74|nr:uncharacterized protein FOBCDRAFT_253361 [Fusarium oxysporum Fo47]QKD60423.2 hypothetical protein FOBCDRAFT_253361 [Fusarium oxysporum Fo47]